MRVLAITVSALLLTASACGGDDSGAGGQGGAITFTGGMGVVTTGGIGVATTGGVGMTTTGGMGGVAGVAGTGTGGTMAGTSGGEPPSCDVYAAMAPGTARGSHDIVAAMLRGDGSATNPLGACAFSSCHSDAANGMLNLTTMPDITTALVNVPACEAPALMRVKPMDPASSWLWIKLTGPADASGNITYATTPQACKGADAGTLGILMPWSPGSPASLEPTQLFQICSWIQDGALGPGT